MKAPAAAPTQALMAVRASGVDSCACATGGRERKGEQLQSRSRLGRQHLRLSPEPAPPACWESVDVERAGDPENTREREETGVGLGKGNLGHIDDFQRGSATVAVNKVKSAFLTAKQPNTG